MEPLDAEDSIVCMKMYGNGDLKNICEEIQTRMVCKLMETDTSHLVTFAQISEICQPAFGIQAMSLDAPNEYIYSTGSNSLSDRMYHNAAVRTGLIRNVLVVGIGGVGSWCAEGLLRSGVTDITIVDSDKVCITNVNRQVMATAATVGQVKVEALKSHLLEINPNARITAIEKAYCTETAEEFDLDSYDYVVDAIDSLKDKYRLILDASASRAKLFCSMGAERRIKAE